MNYLLRISFLNFTLTKDNSFIFWNQAGILARVLEILPDRRVIREERKK